MTSQPIKLGVLSIVVGPYAGLGNDCMRGVEVALQEFRYTVAGRPIQMELAGTMATPDVAEGKAIELLKNYGADIIIGPLSGNEGLAVRNLARNYPNKTFINGTSGAQYLTMDNAPENFFNYGPHGAQSVVGLGEYAAKELGYRRVVTVGEDYTYPYAQVGGFIHEFCQHGGEIVDRFWVPLATKDYTDIINQIDAAHIDAIYVALGGTDAINFLEQLHAITGISVPLVGGTILIDEVEQNVGADIASRLVGTAIAAPFADTYDAPGWKQFIQAYRAHAGTDGYYYPSLFALVYYTATKAALLALEKVDANLSDGGVALRQALRTGQFDAPNGPVRLDSYQAIISTNYVSVIEQEGNHLIRKMVKRVTDVTQTLGLDESVYRALGEFDKENPAC